MDLPLNDRMLFGITETSQGNQGIDNRRKDRAQPVALVKSFQYPLLGFSNRHRTQRNQSHPLEELVSPVENLKKDRPAVMSQRTTAEPRASHPAIDDSKLVDRSVPREPHKLGLCAEMMLSGTTIARDHEDIS